MTEKDIEIYLEELRPKFKQGILRQREIMELLSEDI